MNTTSEKNLLSFSIATFNVHMWVDARFEDNYDRVLKLVKVRAIMYRILLILLKTYKNCNHKSICLNIILNHR